LQATASRWAKLLDTAELGDLRIPFAGATTRYRFNYGPNFYQTYVPTINPPVITPPYEDNPANGPIYPSYVPSTDSDGNDIAGCSCHGSAGHALPHRAAEGEARGGASRPVGSALKRQRPAEPKPGSTAIGMTADLDQAVARNGALRRRQVTAFRKKSRLCA